MTAFTLPQSLVVPVLPELQRSYSTDPATVTWVLTAFLLSAGVATPLLGRLGDAYGQRRILLVALAALTVGCAGAAVAPSIGWLIAARILQGLGGGVVPACFAIIRDEFPPHRVHHAVGVIATFGSVGFAIGLVAAGPLMASVGSTWLFLIPTAVSLLAAVGAFVVVLRTVVDKAARRFAVVPVALFSAGLVCLLLAINKSTDLGWASTQVVGLCGAALLLGIGWVAQERRVDSPFIDLDMMRARGVWTSNLVAFVVGMALFGNAASFPQLLQTSEASGYGVNASLTEVGWLMLPTPVFAFAASMAVGRLLRRFPSRRVLAAGTLLSASSYLGLVFWHDARELIYVWTSLQGFGNGLILSTLASIVVGSVPRYQTGTANGMNANLRTVGGSLGAATAASIIGASVTATGDPEEVGFVVAYSLMAAAMVVATVVSLFVPHRTRTDSDDADEQIVVAGPGATAV